MKNKYLGMWGGMHCVYMHVYVYMCVMNYF